MSPKVSGYYLSRLVALVVVLSSPCAWSQTQPDKPNVQVIFKVEAVRFVGHFGNNLGSFENAVAQRLAPSLEQLFSFLRFTADAQPIRLTVTLANRSSRETCAVSDANCPKETILGLKLEQPNRPPVAYDEWVYLKLEDFFISLGSEPAEVENLQRLGFGKIDVDRVVANVLSNVELSPTAHLLWQQRLNPSPAKDEFVGLTIPVLADALCVDQHSLLVLHSEFLDRFSTVAVDLPVDARGGFIPPENSSTNDWNNDRGYLFGVPASNPPKERTWDPWDVMLGSDKSKIQVKGVFVYQYRRPGTGCSQVVAPNASGLGSGGGN